MMLPSTQTASPFGQFLLTQRVFAAPAPLFLTRQGQLPRAARASPLSAKPSTLGKATRVERREHAHRRQAIRAVADTEPEQAASMRCAETVDQTCTRLVVRP